MSNYRQQSRNVAGGGAISPIVVNNNNFAKGAPGAPTLLSATTRARCSTSSATACTGCCRA